VTEEPTQLSMRALEGQTFGDYVLNEYLGEGGFAAVYLSEQRVLGEPFRRVALKLSRRTDLTEQTARELFADAFLLADALDSITDTQARLHLVQVYDAGITRDRRAYLTMEYVRGTTLAARFAGQSKVPAPQITKWAKQIGLALRALHGLDPPLVHRDLKPDNILLGMDNLVRVVDFGLAARLLDRGEVPGVAGTVAYMAPETSQGTSTPASDIYSLGLLLYEGLTGEHAFKHLIQPIDLPEEAYADWLYNEKRRKPAVRPSVLSNTVTDKLDEIILRCLEFEPANRFSDAAEFIEALERKSPVPPPVRSKLRKGGGKEATENLVRDWHLIEDLLGNETNRDKCFELLGRLGEVLTALGEHGKAATRLGEAWELTKASAILRDSTQRVALLTQIMNAWRRDGNEFQARRYERLRDKERGGDP
jgi:eukaryotic-like serine/threonine-protein kinase